MKRHVLIPLVLAAIGAAVTVVIVARSDGDRAPAVPPEVLEALAGPGPVAPGFHQETETLRARVAEAPEDTAALRQLATLLQDAHRPEEAAAYWRRLLAIAPHDRQAWLDLAHCAAATRDWAGADRAMQSLLAYSPEDLEAMYNLGAIRANAGDPEGAREWWRRVADQVEDPALARRAAESLTRLGDPIGGAPGS